MIQARLCFDQNWPVSSSLSHDVSTAYVALPKRNRVHQCLPKSYFLWVNIPLLFASMPQSGITFSTNWLKAFTCLRCCRDLFRYNNLYSTYFHRVLNPTDAPCSSEYLLQFSYSTLPTLTPPSIKISDCHIKFLGHILRHPLTPESQIFFYPSRTLRTINSPFCRGARGHTGQNWPWPRPIINSKPTEQILQIQVNSSIITICILLLLNLTRSPPPT